MPDEVMLKLESRGQFVLLAGLPYAVKIIFRISWPALR